MTNQRCLSYLETTRYIAILVDQSKMSYLETTRYIAILVNQSKMSYLETTRYIAILVDQLKMKGNNTVPCRPQPVCPLYHLKSYTPILCWLVHDFVLVVVVEVC